ncbi:hypothetical protein QUB75_09325 [Microcoleus sp. K1-B6]|uniref:hypothetical protein n=1 Tax=unclassified Microcoleus TaxID=2642155 RepID=UPI002FD5F46A
MEEGRWQMEEVRTKKEDGRIMPQTHNYQLPKQRGRAPHALSAISQQLFISRFEL